VTGPLLLFLYGLVAGYLLVRLRRQAPRRGPDRRLLLPAARLVLAVSFTLAVLLLAAELWRLSGQGG
jgi:hypothetical protein